jgi:hypothetical protein
MIAVLLPLILAAAEKILAGSLLRFLLPWFAEKFGSFLKAQPEGMVSNVGAAPEDLKAWLAAKLDAFADSIPHAILRSIARLLINRIEGPLLDTIWDGLFAASIVPAPSGDFPKPEIVVMAKVAMPLPSMAEVEDMCRAETASLCA